MFPTVTVKVMRNGTLVYGSIPMQLDRMTPVEAAYYGGSEPYFRYNGYILGNYDIEPQDLLVDLVNIDPKTGVNRQYRVIDNPDDDKYQDGHMEMVLDRVRGT